MKMRVLLITIATSLFFYSCFNGDPVSTVTEINNDTIPHQCDTYIDFSDSIIKPPDIQIKETSGKLLERSNKGITFSIGPGYELECGRNYYSLDKRAILIFQSDGNLVLYYDGEWVGQSHTYDRNSKPDRCVFQLDGNLVLYKGTRPIWHTNTWGMGLTNFELISSWHQVGYYLRLLKRSWPDPDIIRWEHSGYDNNYKRKFSGYEFPDW